MLEHVPDRPVTSPGGKCPFCLQNGKFQGEIIAETPNGVVGKIADDLAIIFPKAHVVEPWDTLFAAEYFTLLQLAIRQLGWEEYNESRNVGYLAGQRLAHLHYKVQRRLEGQEASGFGLDWLINRVNQAS